jgi:hypothetical protein
MGARVATGKIACLAFAGAALLVTRARAQPVEEKPAPAEKADQKKKPAPAEPLRAPEPPPVSEAPKPLPPLPPPRADEQSPRPYLRAAEPERPLRGIEIGPDLGVVVRPSNRDSVSYGAAFAIGGHALIELTRWLGFRALFLRSDHPVTIDRGEFGFPPNTDVHQPDLELVLIAGRFEPTWVVSPRLRLWAGAGAGLAYFAAPVSTTTGRFQVQSARRTGVAVDIGGALGGTFEVIPDWFTVALSGSAAFTTGHTGDAFQSPQAFDSTGQLYHRGSQHHLADLPEFAGSFGATASLGLLL